MIRFLSILAFTLSGSIANDQEARPTSAEAQSISAEKYAGTFRDKDGSDIVVQLEGGQLKLESGPSKFTLDPVSPDHFKVRERALEVSFNEDASEISILENGTAVAQGRRAEAPAEITYQGKALPQWLDQNVPGLLVRYRIPAAGVAVIENGRVSYVKVFGERRRGLPAGLDTRFNVASLTKPVAAEVLLRLVSKGQLDLDAPMADKWVDPDISGDPRAKLLTVRMALQHRTGLPNWRSQTGNELKFLQDPGKSFAYSGEAYTYAARYAERVTGTAFETLAKRLVFAPMGMRHTSFTVSPDMANTIAYPHDSMGRELWPVLRLEFSAACCMYSTIGDYAAFVANVMHDKGLRKDIVDQRFDYGADKRSEMCGGNGVDINACPQGIGMGLGWFVLRYPRESVIMHTGVNDGERSAAFFVPERNFGIVILTNGTNGRRLIRDVTTAAYDNPDYLKLVKQQGN